MTITGVFILALLCFSIYLNLSISALKSRMSSLEREYINHLENEHNVIIKTKGA